MAGKQKNKLPKLNLSKRRPEKSPFVSTELVVRTRGQLLNYENKLCFEPKSHERSP